MHRLTRQARFYLPLSSVENSDASAGHGDENTPLSKSQINRWSSLGPVNPLSPFVEMELTAIGSPCSDSGFVVDIRQLDQWMLQAARHGGAAIDWPVVFAGQGTAQATILAEKLFTQLRSSVCNEACRIERLVLRFSAYFSISIEGQSLQEEILGPNHESHDQPNSNTPVAGSLNSRALTSASDPTMPISRNLSTNQQSNRNNVASPMITLTHQYEFSAAHRLHCSQWSDQKNLQTFGKCNYPSGHGHNYRLELSIQSSSTGSENDLTSRSHENPSEAPQTPNPLSASAWLNQLVHEHVLSKVDHRFLNHDVPEFQTLNPSVENIASVIYDWLTPKLPQGVRLSNVRVYETAKTWADVSSGGSAAKS